MWSVLSENQFPQEEKGEKGVNRLSLSLQTKQRISANTPGLPRRLPLPRLYQHTKNNTENSSLVQSESLRKRTWANKGS